MTGLGGPISILVIVAAPVVVRAKPNSPSSRKDLGVCRIGR
jgi:hypothetical protein